MDYQACITMFHTLLASRLKTCKAKIEACESHNVQVMATETARVYSLFISVTEGSIRSYPSPEEQVEHIREFLVMLSRTTKEKRDAAMAEGNRADIMMLTVKSEALHEVEAMLTTCQKSC